MTAAKTKWIDLTDEFTEAGLAAIKTKQLLTFDYEGSRNQFRVVSRRLGKVWVVPTVTYGGEEAQAIIDDMEHRYNRKQRRQRERSKQ